MALNGITGGWTVNDKPAGKILWLREWTDSQSEGYMSGKVRHIIEFDVQLHPSSGFIPFIEHSAYEVLKAEIAYLKRQLADQHSGCCDCSMFKLANKKSKALKLEKVEFRNATENFLDLIYDNALVLNMDHEARLNKFLAAVKALVDKDERD